MKKIFFLLIICLFFSCDRDESCGCYSYNINTDIKVVNNNNEDLLNPITTNYFTNDLIRVEHLNKNGTYVEFYKSNLDYKYDFKIYEFSGVHFFRLFNQVDKDYFINNKITSVIKWNAAERDTIVTEVNETPNSLAKTKVWVNGELKYDLYNNVTPEVITIVK